MDIFRKTDYNNGNDSGFHRCLQMKHTNKRIHLVNLYKWRSVVAFIACTVTIVLTLGSVVYGILTEPGDTVKTEFEWFTVDSNCLTAFAAFMILPYTVEGIRKKRFVYPKWVLLAHFAGTICITITLAFVLGFISWYDPQLAFGDENFFLHIVCPITVLVSFFMVESDFTLTRRDSLIALIPFLAYALLYFYNVVIARNWEDHYMLNTFAPAYLSLPAMCVLAFVISEIIRAVHNRLVQYRDKKRKAIWSEDLDPVSVKIEVYSLGVHAGLHQEKEDTSLPLDILEEISERFGIKTKDLANAYTRGVIEGRKERSLFTAPPCESRQRNQRKHE